MVFSRSEIGFDFTPSIGKYLDESRRITTAKVAMKRSYISARSLAAVLFGLLLVAASANQSWAQSDWKKEWEKTLAAARKEGQVTIYIYRYEALLQDFKRDYPGITVVSVT